MRKVCVIGVGFVGESLVKIFSKKNIVIGYDISKERVEYLKKKFQNIDNIKIQSNINNIENSELFCISVPTLLLENGDVDDTYIKNAIEIVKHNAKKNSIIVIESSVYVGMTRKLLKQVRESGLFVGFSPERIDPGRENPPDDKIPKIISGIDKISLEKIMDFYGEVFETLVPVSSLEIAEMCKLVENCYRMVNINYINEISDACKNMSLDVYEIINACSTKPFGYTPFYPGLGVGGHCIPVNPKWMAVTCKNDIPTLLDATYKMSERPKKEARNLIKYNNTIKTVLVIGIGFKTGESLTTNSPGLAYAHELLLNSIKVTIFDPLVNMNKFINDFNILKIEEFTTKFIENNFDAVCIAIKQKNIDWNIIKECKNIVIIKYCEI